MKKPIIGIVGRVKSSEKKEIFISDKYRTAITQSGGIAILLLPPYCKKMELISPFQESDIDLKLVHQLVDLCDGILFPGGENWYGFEQEIYRYAFQKNKPILGICLGMQMIACFPYFHQSCSDCTYPIVSKTLHKQELKYAHEIFLKDSLLKNILDVDQMYVNSRHSYEILQNDSFVISSYSLDGVIESIEVPGKDFILGVQWHPESLFEEDVFARKIFQAFIQACRKNDC